ncbi:MAG: hypothetical protein ACJ762_12305 [Solirubrobacteraceae bacterium]
MTRRRATALISVLVALTAPAAARADGDPASDVLLFQDAYLPYFPQPTKAVAQTLTRLLAQVRADGYGMKVALIGSAGDLGAYPEMLGRPENYAKLLTGEIAFRVKNPHLLIVMADGGLAGRNLGPGQDVLDDIEIDPAAQTDGLIRAAIEAVAKIATANGHQTAVPEIKENTKPAATDDGGKSHALLYVLAGAIVALGLGLIAVSEVIRRRRSAA